MTMIFSQAQARPSFNCNITAAKRSVLLKTQTPNIV